MTADRLRCSAPGRVCLFGEHQDYLRLPVIPCAISLRIAVEGVLHPSREVSIRLPDIKGEEKFSLDGTLPYPAERDYFRSAVNVLRRHGFTFSRGMECTVRGEIPINAGTSSSSALVVAWVNYLARMSDQRTELDPGACARLAHEAEVVEFGEPGGEMDHYSTAFGGVMYLEFVPETRVTMLRPALGAFVLGDSMEPKDTKGILRRVKDQVLAITARLEKEDSGFSLHTIALENLPPHSTGLSPDERLLLVGTIRNRDITRRARTMLEAGRPDHAGIGALLTEHQEILRDVLHISTPKIDRMIDSALAAGAHGAKINGSGGGGCMFAYAPANAQAVAGAVERAGGKVSIVTVATGTRAEYVQPEG